MILKIKDLGFLLFCFLVFGLTGCGVFKEEDTSGDPKFNLQTVNIILQCIKSSSRYNSSLSHATAHNFADSARFVNMFLAA